MQKEILSVIYDRKKEVLTKGTGKVEIRIYLGNKAFKYVTIHKCDPFAWKRYQVSAELRTQLLIYKNLIKIMQKNGEELTIENINAHMGKDTTASKERREVRQKKASKTGFIDFMTEQISKEIISAGTMSRRKVVVEAVKRFGRLNSFSDITPKNIKAFDEFLHKEDPSRTAVSVYNYHKTLKIYTRLAANMEYIATDPYAHPLCKFERGKCHIRKPLTEEELIAIRKYPFRNAEERVRDLFIFCAYTGLAYADSQNFDFETMTEKINGQYYIDGERVKTGCNFFTPILPPAMEVLKKYKYKLPHISNQKANVHLHVIEALCGIHKPMTTHVARHSFATLALSYDIPIENVARMLGHTDIKTTQIYARILKSTIERHANTLASLIR